MVAQRIPLGVDGQEYQVGVTHCIAEFQTIQCRLVLFQAQMHQRNTVRGQKAITACCTTGKKIKYPHKGIVIQQKKMDYQLTLPI